MCHYRLLTLMEEMARGGGTAHSGAAMVPVGCAGEAGWNDEEGDALHLKELSSVWSSSMGRATGWVSPCG